MGLRALKESSPPLEEKGGGSGISQRKSDKEKKNPGSEETAEKKKRKRIEDAATKGKCTERTFKVLLPTIMSGRRGWTHLLTAAMTSLKPIEALRRSFL